MPDQIDLSLTLQEWGEFSTVLHNAGRLIREAEVVTDVATPYLHCWVADELDKYRDLISQRIKIVFQEEDE